MQVKNISLERVFCYLQGNYSINVLKWEFKTFLCFEGFPYYKVLLQAGSTVRTYDVHCYHRPPAPLAYFLMLRIICYA